MDENENKKLPELGSIDEIVTFFDENDLGDYLETMPEAEFEVDLVRRKHFIEVDDDVAARLSEISRTEHASSGALANSWLREKISDYSRKE